MRKFCLLLFLITQLYSCSKTNASDKAELTEIVFSYQGELWSTSIVNYQIHLDKELPYYATGELVIHQMEISSGAKSSSEVGDSFRIENDTQVLSIVSENGATTRDYYLQPALDVDGLELFTNYDSKACGVFETIVIDQFVLENNMWNADRLDPGSYAQCVYRKNDLVGWTWEYPEDAYGVNAYPQIIYGWKPWQSNSSTDKLPVKIADIEQLKIDFEVKTYRNQGDYNLAFDNWINSSAEINPRNIQFEFMIWEDASTLTPFGDFVETVETSNGSYDFYRGEPDWEPEGSNWTYLAFVRKENRLLGTTDIDELLEYLVGSGVVSDQSYLGSIEFGNEVGNSTGYTLLKKFEIRH